MFICLWTTLNEKVTKFLDLGLKAITGSGERMTGVAKYLINSRVRSVHLSLLNYYIRQVFFLLLIIRSPPFFHWLKGCFLSHFFLSSCNVFTFPLISYHRDATSTSDGLSFGHLAVKLVELHSRTEKLEQKAKYMSGNIMLKYKMQKIIFCF